jgi:hypothetical protein
MTRTLVLAALLVTALLLAVLPAGAHHRPGHGGGPLPKPTPTVVGEPTATATATIPSTPTPAPPATATPSSAVVAGQPCPDWVHDLHGMRWHPVVDPTYGCHFTHEHGSDPARVPCVVPPVFGAGTPHHMHESEWGFKAHAIQHDSDPSIMAYITVHFGTSRPDIAVCQRFHWMNAQFVQNGELVANLTYLVDFGAAARNTDNAYFTRSCPHPDTGVMMTQQQIAAETNGVRLNPVGPNPTFYYPWRNGSSGLSNTLGWWGFSFTVNTPTVKAFCNDLACDTITQTGGHGAWRFVAFGTGWGVRSTGQTGEFCSNIYGTVIVSCDDAGAIPQYMKAGTDIRFTMPSVQHSYFPDTRHGGTHGDYVYTALANGSSFIMGNVQSVVDPQHYILGPN